MYKNQNCKMSYACVAYPMLIFLMLYVFAYHLAYPFSSTIFLYIAFGCSAVYLCLKQRFMVNNQIYALTLVVFVSACGLFYTDNFSAGLRETILNAVILTIFITVMQDSVLLKKMKKVIFYCCMVVLAGVLLHYLLKDSFNVLMKRCIRADCYENLILSYTVDGAYAGFSAYVADAAYFCAVLYGFVFFDLLENSKNFSKKGKYLRIITVVLCVFAIILTSKRGLIVALAISCIFTYVIWKKASFKTIVTICTACALAYIFVLILGKNNEAIGNFLARFDTSENGDITTGRTEIWAIALEHLTNVVFGMGTGSTNTILKSGCHNIYLQILYEHGFIGLTIYIYFFIYNLKTAIQRRQPFSMYIQLVLLVYGISGNPIYSTSFFTIYSICSITQTNTSKNELYNRG